MRGLGDFKHLLTLYARGESGRATNPLGTVYAAKRTASGKEFLELGAMHQQSTVIFTIRRPINWQLDSGIECEDSRGRRWQAVEVTPNLLYSTCLDVRCVSTQLEGIGYA
ncbi:MAG: head-tail adaptor protein [Clostridia bacterium]|nr:head-tail adaptor protein [Clostridia bacterium]